MPEAITSAGRSAGFAPAGYHSLQPYLIFQNTVQAIDFYTTVFGAKERLRMNDDNGRIMHCELEIGDSTIMLADEHPAVQAFSTEHYGGSPVSLMLYVEHCDTTHLRAVEAGATSIREPADQPHGDRMAGVVDPFGYKWFIAHPLQPTPVTP